MYQITGHYPVAGRPWPKPGVEEFRLVLEGLADGPRRRSHAVTMTLS